MTAIHVVDPATGRFLDINQTACRALGYSREEMLSMSLPDIVDDGEAAGSPCSRPWKKLQEAGCQNGRSPAPSQGRLDLSRSKSMSGTSNWIATTWLPWCATSPSASGRRRSNSARAGSCDSCWNPPEKESMGSIPRAGAPSSIERGPGCLAIKPEELLGRNMHDLAHHHQQDGSVYPVEECPIFRAFQTGLPCWVDTDVFWRADGSSFPVEYSSSPIIENGATTGAVVTVSDITERKRAEEQIAEQAALLDKARDAILVRDIDGKILFWNKGAELMYGWTRDEALGRNAAELYYSDSKKFEEIDGIDDQSRRMAGRSPASDEGCGARSSSRRAGP